MIIYIKNKITEEIIELEAPSFEALDKGIRENYIEITEEEISNFRLENAKESKIGILKSNRDANLNKDLVSIQAKEYGTDNLVYFAFRTKPTQHPITQPSAIIFGALVGGSIKYSCKIIEYNNDVPSYRFGYVEIDKQIAEKIRTHMEQRAVSCIAYTNEQELLINSCNSLEELQEKIENNEINLEMGYE